MSRQIRPSSIHAWKIVERLGPGEYKYLFHDRRRIICDGDELVAEKKMVYESYDKEGRKNLYMSGIHVIDDYRLCKDYMKRFKDRSNKVIVHCWATGYRKKPKGRPGVLLADRVIVTNQAGRHQRR